MKRFCIFLITGTVVIFLFLILAILFKGIGLYIAMAVIATIFLNLSLSSYSEPNIDVKLDKYAEVPS